MGARKSGRSAGGVQHGDHTGYIRGDCLHYKEFVMRARAAVAWEAGQPLSLEEIDVADPKAGEVRVRIVATGVCHTDAYTLSGTDPEGLFPSVLGHEGGGIVEAVGAGVTSVAPGDPLHPP